MRIRKYDFSYSRRVFMEKVSKGVVGAGVLAQAWPLAAKSGDVSKAYPDELLSIDMYTKGKVKTGDVIDANNVDHVKDIMEPVMFMQIKTMGRKVTVTKTTGTDVTTLFPHKYLEATLRNQGKAKFGPDGNVYAPDGGPWIGGLPFPDPKTAMEVQADLALSWGRHDYSQYAVRDWEVSRDGNVDYHYDFCWAELNATARTDGKVFQNNKDKLRFQSVWFTAPDDTKGSSFLNIWYYDQRKFPDLYGYLPAFRRVRQFPTNQRFEPLVPGMTFFLSDAWAAGDPMLTWGNYKIVGRAPLLAPISPHNWFHDAPNFMKTTHGGPKGQTFWDAYVELVPETIIVEAEPTSYPRAPVGKKRVWTHGINNMHMGYVTFDRRGDLWKSFEGAFVYYKKGDKIWAEPDGKPKWSWNYAMSYDVQAGRMTRFYHAEHEASGFKSLVDPTDFDYYNKYLTNSAITRLGVA